jgi:hypothetical protein
VAKVHHEGYFLFAALGFGIMAFGILSISQNSEIRTQDNGIRNIGIPKENVHFRIMGFFGKKYIREIGIREIVRQGIMSAEINRLRV